MTLLQALSQDMQALVAKTSPAVVSVRARRGQGSGLVLAQDGYVLTNAHVARQQGELVVGTADGEERPAQIVGADPRTDLAVLRIDAARLTSLSLADSKAVRVGQLVVAIGNPLYFERSVSLGVVSALDRALPAPGGHLFEGLIQTDAAINPGNSGGPLVDADGAAVGINTAIIPYAQGIGFAIPARTAGWVASVLIAKGEVTRPFIGIAAHGVELGAPLSHELGQTRAVKVVDVGSASPAGQAGIRTGDLLLAANGDSIASVDDLQRILVLGGSPELRLEVLRDQRREQIVVRPGGPRVQTA